MLADAAYIQEKDHEFLQRRGKAGPDSEPLYTIADAVATQELMRRRPLPPALPRPQAPRRSSSSTPATSSARPRVDLRLTEGGNHRLVFSGDIGRSRPSDHPRPRAAVGPDRHADRRVDLRRPRPRVGRRRRGTARRGRAARRRARREGADPRLRASGGRRSWSTPPPAPPRRARSPRSRSTSTARSRST